MIRYAKILAIIAILLGTIVIASIRPAAADANPKATPQTTIFVVNNYDVTAYPANGHGNIAPIALTTDMAAPSAIARDKTGRIYVTNVATNTITVYSPDANGNVPPIAVIGGSNTRLANPTGITLDANGKIYVLNTGEYPGGSITVYPPLENSTGILNEAPIATIAGAKTLLNVPTGIALDTSGNIYVTNQGGGALVEDAYYSGTVTVYIAGSSGNVSPSSTIVGAATGLIYPISIAVNDDGKIYVGNGGVIAYTKSGVLKFDPSINTYSPAATGNAPPIATISGDKTGLSYPQAVALDSNSNLYSAGGNDDTVRVYPLGSSGNAPPSASLAGPHTGLNLSNGIVLDGRDALYVLNSNGGPTNGGSLTVYPAGSGGDAAPIATVTSSFTGINLPSGIAADSIGNIYLTNRVGGADNLGSVNIFPAASRATGAPSSTIAGEHTGLVSPMTIALDSKRNISVLNSDNSITNYPAGSDGDVMPRTTLTVDRGGNNFPNGIAVDVDGKLYVANQGVSKCKGRFCYQTSQGSVAVFSAGSDGNAKPIAFITGPKTKLASPSAIAVGRHGKIYVTNQGPPICTPGCSCFPNGHGSITVYSPDSNGNVEPVARIAGPHTRLGTAYAISLDSNGNVYVLNYGSSFFGFVGSCLNNSQFYNTHSAEGTVTETAASERAAKAGRSLVSGPILVFAAGSDGDTPPIAAIGGPFTGLYGPSAIAISPGN